MQPPPEPVRARIPFTACLQAFTEPENVPDFWSSALQAKSAGVKWAKCHLFTGPCSTVVSHLLTIYTHNYCVSLSSLRTSRFSSFPEYLILQIKKFTFGVDWVPKKLGTACYPHRFIGTVLLCINLNAQQRASADFISPAIRCNCLRRVCFVQQMTNKTKIGNLNSLFVLVQNTQF